MQSQKRHVNSGVISQSKGRAATRAHTTQQQVAGKMQFAGLVGFKKMISTVQG